MVGPVSCSDNLQDTTRQTIQDSVTQLKHQERFKPLPGQHVHDQISSSSPADHHVLVPAHRIPETLGDTCDITDCVTPPEGCDVIAGVTLGVRGDCDGVRSDEMKDELQVSPQL